MRAASDACIRGLLMVPVLPLPCCGATQIAAWQLSPAPASPVEGLPKVNALGIADFNGDDRPDIIAINGDPGELLILINHGGGRFAALSNGGRTAIGETASGLAVADVNADGASDVVLSYHDRDEIGVLLAKADGGFEALRMQTLLRRSQGSPHVHNLAVGDINLDGHVDVLAAQADDNAIAWALGDGAGGFAPAQSFAAGRHPYTIVVADLNNDGHLDLAAPNAESDDLTVGLGDGAARFTVPAPASSSRGSRPRLPRRTLALAAGDINGDRVIDLVASSDVNQRELAVLIGDGRGGFSASEQSFAAPGRCYGQIVADLNGDGANDVAAPCIDRAAVYVWLAEDAKTFRFRRVEFATPGTDSQVLAIADVNGDRILDAIAAGWDRPTIAVLLGERQATEP